MTVEGARCSAESESASILLPRILILLAKGAGRAGLILSGGISSGKTRTAEAVVRELARHGIPVGGVLCPRVLEKGETVGYQARDVATGEGRPFASLEPPGTPVGRYFVSDEALVFAKEAIRRGAREARVVFADEIGRWELAGGGLAPAVRILLDSRALAILLVRDTLVEAAVETFGIRAFEIFPVDGGA